MVDQGFVPLSKFLPQPLELAFIFPKKCFLINVLIHGRLVFDVLCAISKLHRAEGFEKGVNRRGDHGHHGGFAIATKGVFEQASDFRVSVRDVGLLAFSVGECSDDVAEAAEGLIDLFGLLESPACGTSDADAL